MAAPRSKRAGRKRRSPVSLPNIPRRADDDGPYWTVVGPSETVIDANGDVGGTLRKRHTRDLICETPEQKAAWDQFSGDFQRSQLNGYRVAQTEWLPVSARGQHLSDRIVAAREGVMSALQALGGVHTWQSDIVWHIIGMDMSIRDYAGGSGRQRECTATALVDVINILVRHYRGEL